MELQELFTKYKMPQDEQDFVSGLIEAEKNLGITESRKKNKEAQTVRAELNRLRDLLKANLELDPEGELEEQITALKEKLQKSSKTSDDDGKSNAEIEKLRKEMKAMTDRFQKQIDEEKTAKEAVQQRLRNSKIKEVLDKAMGDVFIGKELVIKDFIREGKVKLTDDENVVFVDGDDEIELTKGIDLFRKNNSDLVRNNQVPGSGGSPKVDVGKKGNKISQEQYESLSLEDQKSFFSNGGKLLTE